MERRNKQRKITDQYYSVELSIKGLDFIYQFKLRNISQNGMCIIINENSQVLLHLKINDLLNMKYYSTETPNVFDQIITRIKHITPCKKGRFQGHCLVGLEIIKEIIK